MSKHEILIDKDLCIGCGLCKKDCPESNISIENGKAAVISNACIMCGHCSAVCPNNAVLINGFNEEPVPFRDVRINPEDILDTVRFRRSIRSFKPDSIPDEIIDRIIEAGALNHTAKNMQDVSFIVLKDQINAIQRYAVKLARRLFVFVKLFNKSARRIRIEDDFFFFGAPIAIVIIAKDTANGLLAAQTMEFQAETYGLGALFSGFFTIAANLPGKVKRALKVERGKKVAATLVIGRPNVKYMRSAQREKPNVKYM